MPRQITFSEDDVALVVCVLKQLGALTPGKVDYDIVQRDLGLAAKNTAKTRWHTFSKKLRNSMDDTGADEEIGEEIPTTPKRKPRINETTAKKRKKSEGDDKMVNVMADETKRWEE